VNGPAYVATSNFNACASLPVSNAVPRFTKPMYWQEKPVLQTVAPLIHSRLPLRATAIFSAGNVLDTLFGDAKEPQALLGHVA
jgi:hypothetical protein